MSIFPYVLFCHVFILLQLCEIIFCGEKRKRIQSSSSMVDWKFKKKKQQQTLMCIQSQASLSFASHVTETPMSSPQFALCLCPSATLQATEAGEAEGHPQDPTEASLLHKQDFFPCPPWVALKIGGRVGSSLCSWVSPSARRCNWSLRSQVKVGVGANEPLIFLPS